jgi:hypothetical protein
MNSFFLLLGTLLPTFTTAQNVPDSTLTNAPKPGVHLQPTYDEHQRDLLGAGTWHVGFNTRGSGWGGYTGFTGRVAPRISYFLRG